MISIIIPTLNEESVLENTLISLKRLTLPHEIIVSDGKSTDKTLEIARKHADKVIAYSEKERQTIARGRNDGARAAQGEFLAFMDADCSMLDLDVFFSKALNNFEDRSLAALVAWVQVLPHYETISDRIIFFLYNSYLTFINNVLKMGVSGGEFQMMRREDFVSIGGYNEALVASEDVDLLNRLSKKGKILLDRHLVVFHTGRRAHKIGWPKLLWLWSLNAIWMMTRGKAYSKEWKPIR